MLQQFKEDTLKKFDEGCNVDNISDPPSDKEWIKDFISQALDAQVLYLQSQMPEKRELDDVYTDEEKELLNKISPNHKTPEYLRERRYGFNSAVTQQQKAFK